MEAAKSSKSPAPPDAASSSAPSGSEMNPIACVFAGLKDALSIWKPFDCLINAKIPGNDTTVLVTAAYTFGLNGVIFLGSQLFFELILRPLIHYITAFFGNSPDYEDKMIPWIDFTFTIFYNFGWIFPVFVFTKVVNSLWYQDIANGAYHFFRGEPSRNPNAIGFKKHFIVSLADTLFTTVLQLNLLIFCGLVGLLPQVGPVIAFIYGTWMTSLYCFEYTWINASWDVGKRIAYFEEHWAYFIGFGIPFTIVTNYVSFLVSSGLFAIFFPWFIITASCARPVASAPVLFGLPDKQGLPIVCVGRWLTRIMMMAFKKDAHRKPHTSTPTTTTTTSSSRK